MTVSPELETREVILPSGTLRLRLETATAPLESLLTYAVRRNPKRGFLFVSRVLGKHIPIAPEVAARTYRTLAAALPELHAPHFIGLAETATALGEGVFRAWLDGKPNPQSGQTRSGTFQHTTRYHTQFPLLLRFDEPHSHAPAHLVYDPGPAARAATELVLIDDELSTGTTLQNLAAAWLELHPHVLRVVLVSLTDWCPRRRELAESLGVQVDFVSLTRGELSFMPDPDWHPAALPAVVGNGADKTALLPAQSARYGHLTALPTLDTLGLTFHPTDRVLVLGTGEYQYPAFALAGVLAPGVASCLWNATTRSPILPGLAIRHTLSFTDNVSDGIPNFVYNVDPSAYSRILVAYEGACLPGPALMAALGPHAQAVRLSP